MVLTGYAIYNVLCMRLDWYLIREIARHDAMTRYCTLQRKAKRRKTEFVSNKSLCVWASTGMECILFIVCLSLLLCICIRRHFGLFKSTFQLMEMESISYQSEKLVVMGITKLIEKYFNNMIFNKRLSNFKKFKNKIYKKFQRKILQRFFFSWKFLINY